MELHLVEPDPQALQAIGEGTQSGAKQAFVHPIALSGANGSAQLFVTAHGSMSSLLEPAHDEFTRAFGEVKNAPAWAAGMEVKKKIDVPTRTLAGFVSGINAPFIDFLKLDTQGNELEILKSGEELLRAGRVGVICAEVAFFPVYKGQSYFSEIDIFLRSCGFRFVECRSYSEVMNREDEFTPGSKLYERPKKAPVGDAWYVFDWNQSRENNVELRSRSAVVLAAELYFSEAKYLLNETLGAGAMNELFRYLSHPVRESALRHFLRRWTPPAIQQWRAKRRK